MAMKLRDLIRKVRACKTAAEERSVIAKESAMIRTAIREEQAHFRHRNVAKLLFMHMLGYPTHFGQLECMKLVASPHFPEKRIGYLGMMLLLSEEADVLMLATNALKNDLNSDNRFIAGLALCCIGNLATADMSRDLVPEVDKHLKSPLAYLRKKACLAMVRCLAKCPDMVEDFVDRLATLLQDKSHGVLITVVQLMTQVLMIDYKNAQEEGTNPFDTDCRTAFLALVPNLVKLLRNLLGSGFSSDYDVGGIADPFLQVQILTLLRLLGVHNVEASEEMNDVLAQVASNTDSAKNAGNAILYECVQTIMGTESEDGLRVLAVNILGRFLLNRDNNIRYVALNTLSRCIVEQKQFGRDDDSNSAMSALQRHRQTVVDCLRDPDISIRQRALELIYHLVNESNVESLTAELLSYLVLCPREHRSDICTRILKVVNRFGPDDRWKVDTLITTLTIAGREASSDVQSAAVIYISRSGPDIHAFATHKLLKAIRDGDGCQLGLLTVGVWCVGEYGDLLLQPYSYKATESSSAAMSSDGISVTFMALDTTTVIDVLQGVTQKHSCPEVVKERALTAYVKLSNRFSSDVGATTRLQTLIEKHRSSRSLEMQVRSCEYKTLLNAAKGLAPQAVSQPSDDLFGMTNDSNNTNGGRVSDSVATAAKEALARMPVVDIKLLHKRLTAQDGYGEGDSTPRAPRQKAPMQNGTSGGDLLDIFGGDVAPVQNGVGGGGAAAKSDLDLLSDIFASTTPAPASGGYDPFGASSVSAPAAVNPMDLFGAPPAAAMAPANNNSAPMNAMDLFGGGPTIAAVPVQRQAPANDIFGAPAPQTPAATRVKAVNHAGLDIEFECTKPDGMNQQKSVLVAHMKNTTGSTMNGVNLQVAVPKYVKMEMEPPTATTIPPAGGGKSVTQKITVINSMMGTKNLVLKLKVGFTANGQKVDHMATCSGFPPGQY